MEKEIYLNKQTLTTHTCRKLERMICEDTGLSYAEVSDIIDSNAYDAILRAIFAVCDTINTRYPHIIGEY